MAETKSKKKKSTAAKSTKSAKASSAPKKKTKAAPSAPPEEAPPVRREVGAVIFALLGVFMLISFFNQDGFIIEDITQFTKGLVGWGYWITPAAFFIAAFDLAFHRGRPVAAKVWCALLIPVLFAAIGGLMFPKKLITEELSGEYINALFNQGVAVEGGGVLGGLLGKGLEKAISIYGALPVLLVAFVVCFMVSCSIKAKQLVEKIEKRANVQYDPAMYEKPEKEQKTRPYAEDFVVKNDPSYAQSTKPAQGDTRRNKRAIDIPLGDDEEELPLRRFEERTEAKKTTVRPKKVDAKPLMFKQAEPIPAVEPDEDGFLPLDAAPKGGKTDFNTITMSAEVSDPPKQKRLKKEELEAEAKAVEQAIAESEPTEEYAFPPTSLLRQGENMSIDSRDEVSLNRERLEKAIHSFGISAKVCGVIRGPTVTRYDLELDQGVKLTRITNLSGDLALSLGVVNVRIAPIPDKISTVGIEVPNKIVSTVYLRELIESAKFTTAKSKLTFAIGKDIGGDCIVGNISKLPHMLIAGTTGSGKSVCMNSLILSILYKATPDEVKFIMIDPKMVELGIYNGIPHLYVPVVTDPKKAAGALQWSVVEMMKRYRMFSEVGVRDLASYNKHCETAGENKLPQVVVVIDELADLMLVASKDVEESICRVAQMGRAAGVHLVIATQRPSADVITGLMKANIPSRIAFAVSSAMESRIILDAAGAEKLVGMGDMLYAPLGSGKPTRIQGAYVSDEEREDVINFIKENSSASLETNSEINEFMNKAADSKDKGEASSKSEGGKESSEYDEMLQQAVEVVLEMKSCSVSLLQRRVKLGYARAARVVDQMEELGIVGPYEGAKPRSVIIDKQGWHDLQIKLGMIEDDGAAQYEDNYVPEEDTDE